MCRLESFNPSIPSSQTTDSCYVTFILKKSRHPTSLHIHIPSSGLCDSPQSRETGNGAERRDSPARDWNQIHTRTHKHTRICTDTPKPPERPICFQTCRPQRRLSASLRTDIIPHMSNILGESFK